MADVFDFQSDVENLMEAYQTDLDTVCEKYVNPGPEEFSLHEFFQQSANRRPRVSSPSSLTCPRKMYFKCVGAEYKINIKPDSLSLMFFGFVLGKVFSALSEELYGGFGEAEVDIPELNVYGHCDHLFIREETGNITVLEFKTSAKSVYQSHPDYYEQQTATYAHGLGAQEAYLVLFWMDGRKFRTIPVDIDERWKEAETLFKLVKKHVSIGIPPIKGPKNTFMTCRDCGFREVCKEGAGSKISKLKRWGG